MTPDVAKVVLAAHHASCSSDHETLFVDEVPVVGDTPAATLGDHYEALGGLSDPTVVETLWRCGEVDGDRRLVVLSARRTGRELFRALALVERHVASGGAILLLPPGGDEGDDARPEATEVFCGAYPAWSRRLIEARVVELRKDMGSNGGVVSEQISDRERGPSPPARVMNHAAAPTSRAIPPLPPDAPKYLTREHLEQLSDIRRKKVVSLAVFGDSRAADEHWRRMPQYLACWVRAHHALFPGYELRIHHDDWLYQTNYGDVLHGLQRRGLVKLVRVAPDGIAIGRCKAMLWRLLPAWDPEVSHVFCRDVDSLPTWRDRMACEEFIESEREVGVIHDNPQHAAMMGGLCHFDAAAVRLTVKGIDALTISNQWTWETHGADQHALNWFVAEFDSPVLEHSLFTTEGEGGARQHRATPTLLGADFRTEIVMPAPSLVESIPLIVRQKSDGLIPYLGAAGFDTERAKSFYSAYSPVADIVRDAENFV